MQESFEKLGLMEDLIIGLRKAGLTLSTPIQAQVIPLTLQGQDVIGQSPTGTGKTLAYLLPLFQKIDPGRREMQALVLAPTNELAIQIKRHAKALAADSGLPIRTVAIIGKVNVPRQIERLKEKPQLIVGTTGRVLELIRLKKITGHTLKTIVLDEADRLLDETNLEQVKAIIKTTLKERQLICFSATLTPAALSKAAELMREPRMIKIGGPAKAAAADKVSHRYRITERRDKIEALRKLTGRLKIERALVFVNRSYDIENTLAKLLYHGLPAAGIHRSLPNPERQKAINDFHTGKIQLLVATDLAARGLDIPVLTHVINLDLPESPQVYLHRAGRTGRAGQSGTVISLVTPREAATIKKYGQALKIEVLALT